MRDIALKTSDDITLAGQLFEHESPEGVTIIHGATGVPFRYYSAFAQWYAEKKKHNVLIYEYRDSGNLTNEEIRNSRVTMSDWGVLDQSAALDYVVREFPNLEIHTIGHSLGGFCIPFHKNASRIKSHTGINSGLAYWPTHPWHFMPQIMLFWFIIGPLLTKLLGYMPGFLLGMKNNLPSGVYWQWRRWCTNEKLHEIDWGSTMPKPDLTRFKGDLIILGASDDAIIPWNRVKILDRFFPEAKSVTKLRLKPSDYKLKAIGHIAFFSASKKPVWEALFG